MEYKYDVFISYSRIDTPIADQICDALHEANISYFIDRQGIGGGMEFPLVLAHAIRESALFLFLGSNSSYKSKFTINEITYAFNKKERNHILPYIIDDSRLPEDLEFVFAGINNRTIKDHPIVETLIPDLLKLLGREKEIDIQKERKWVLDYLQLTDEWKIYAEKGSKHEMEQQNQTDDLGYLLEYDDDSILYLWDRFISSLLKHEIIPVIGPEYQIASNANFHKQIINYIAKHIEIQTEPDSFSQLIQSTEFMMKFHGFEKIYYMIDKLLERYRIDPSPWLAALIKSKLFPFVINTSFTPTIEDEMRKTWGQIKILNYSNSPYYDLNNDFREEKDLVAPTICYIFGKYGNGIKRFAVTEHDYREFSKGWIREDLDRFLYRIMKQSYLLFIGYEPYKGEESFLWKDLQSEKDFGHRSFSEFLEVIGKGIVLAPDIVLKEILSRVDKEMEKGSQMKFEKPQDQVDVYISCSRSDSEIAQKLFESLTKLGLQVWYEKKNLSIGSDFMDEIRNYIRTARYFVPILSRNITKEKNEPRMYRREWIEAIEHAKSMGRTFIIPIVEDGVDFYVSRIPEEIQRHNAICYSKDGDFDDVAKQIVQIMNQD